MDRKRISGPARGADRSRSRKKASPGLRIVERDGHWHVQGTIRVKGNSVRKRCSTELPARDELWDDADQIRRDLEAEVRNEVIHGVKPSRPLAIAAREFLDIDEAGAFIGRHRSKPIGPTDATAISELVEVFGTRLINTITATEWTSFFGVRHEGNGYETKLRYLNTVRAFLDWCTHEARAYLTKVPAIDIGRKPDVSSSDLVRARRRVGDITPDLLAFLFGFAAPHLKAQLYVEWCTGARVSSVLFGCRLSDLMLTERRQQIRFRATKNGDDVEAKLHPIAVDALREYLEWRGGLDDRDAPLFLTHRRKPYSTKGRDRGWSTANKTAFNAMRRRALYAILLESVRARRAGDIDRALELRSTARLIRPITQHWLRHWFATHAMAQQMPRRFVQDQGGWRDQRSLERYAHDVSDARADWVSALPIADTPLTRAKIAEKK